MTEKEKTHITTLRERGYTYKQISDETGIGLSTVKMHFNRMLAHQHPACVEITSNTPVAPIETTNAASTEHDPVCLQCGEPLGKDISGRRRFCSDRCRIRWWMEHPEQLRNAKKHQHQCPICGKMFFAYKPAQYCSLDCYHHSRRKAG